MNKQPLLPSIATDIKTSLNKKGVQIWTQYIFPNVGLMTQPVFGLVTSVKPRQCGPTLELHKVNRRRNENLSYIILLIIF